MALESQNFRIKGMQQDTTKSIFSNEFAFENMNINITSQENNTLLSVSSEKGNIPVDIRDENEDISFLLQGIPLGYGIINDILIIFTKGGQYDFIYKIRHIHGELRATELFKGSLNFDSTHPIETVSFYENEDIQKIYWIDGLNQARLINISGSSFNEKSFDFVQTLSLKEKVTINKKLNTNGIFPSGVIQYAFTYLNDYGQESNIFYTSPLYNTSFTNKGGTTEEVIGNSFEIKLENLDLSFNYVRIYSIVRTSIDSTPTIKNIIDLSIKSHVVTTVLTHQEIQPVSFDGVDDILLSVNTGRVIINSSSTTPPYEYFEIPQTSCTLIRDNVSLGPLYIHLPTDTLYVRNSPPRYSLSDYTIINLQPGDIIQFSRGNSIGGAYNDGMTINGNSLGFNYTEPILESGVGSPQIGESYYYRYLVTMSGMTVYYDEVSNRQSLHIPTNVEPEIVTIYDSEGNVIDSGPGIIVTITETIQETISIEQLFTDNNTIGNIVDNTLLLYVGGEPIVPKTITQKDNTLFLGNISLLRLPAGSENLLRGGEVSFSYKTLPLETVSSLYDYKTNSLLFKNSLNKYESFKSFKTKEWYRFGIQLQHKTGIWSEVIYINDCKNNLIPQMEKNNNDISIKSIIANYQLSSENINYFINKGYIRARGVVVFPSINDRSVIAQGVLNPTLYNLNDRASKLPDIISSWYFRPIPREDIKDSSPGYNPDYGEYVEYRHNYSLPKNTEKNCEIQESGYNDTYPGVPVGSSSSIISGFKNTRMNQFYIDSSIVTMHSPDIEFDDNIKNISTENLKLRIIGLTSINGFNSKITLSTSGSTFNNSALGFVDHSVRINNWVSNRDGGKVLCSGAFFNDKNIGNNSNELYVIYPWHSSGSVNSDTNRTYAKLEHKRFSNLRYSDFNYYLTDSNTGNSGDSNKIDAIYNLGISKIKIFNSNEVETLRLDSPNNSPLGNLFYQGNVDKLIVPTDYKTNYSVYKSSNGLFGGTYSSVYLNGNLKTDPIRIQFKSTPHAVFSLDWNNVNQQVLLPGFDHNRTYQEEITPSNNPLWSNYSFGTYRRLITIDKADTDKSSGLWLAELYRDDNDVINRFGGTSQAAIESNNWIPCGEPVSLIDSEGNGLSSVYVKYTEGDTYIQRYDCLKTYGDISNEQSMVEILSFICETRINIDARTDNNRGMEDNRLMTPSNFNIFNKVYNQKNNYFPVNVINYNRFSLDNFPNTITWTKSKVSGDIVDTWTNITLASVLDLDGVYGPVTSLNNFGNEIIAFQNTAMSNILFNSRVQINASDGVPIEIANSYKVDGKRYISTKVGTTNKWSVKDSIYGLYFIDNISKGIYIYDGKLKNISDELGFHSWAINNLNNQEPYSYSNNNFTTHVDNINNKVYFINNEVCLVYSEQLQQFTSFMSYEGSHFMMNVFNKFLSLRQPFNVSYENRNYFNIWEHGVGNYNKYFGVIKPSWITIIANDKSNKDKIFNTVEIRADAFNNNVLTAEVPFNTLTAWNEYQNGSISLSQEWNKGSSFKQKFRIWRANIPGSSIVNSNLRPSNSNRFSIRQDRMRNPWLYIKLESNGLNGYQTVLQDITVNYSI